MSEEVCGGGCECENAKAGEPQADGSYEVNGAFSRAV
jgi:hypothetical protein